MNILDMLPPSDPDKFTQLWSRYHLRWQNRDDRMDTIDKVVRGEWGVFNPDDSDEELTSRSPNLIQVALEDTAEASALRPSVRVTASGVKPEDKERAEKMEQLGSSYLDSSEFDLLAVKSFLNLYAYGLFSWVVTWSKEFGPRIEWRDPRSCFPEPDYSTLAGTQRCFFARDVYVTQLPPEYQAIWRMHCDQEMIDPGQFIDRQVTLVEYYDAERITVAGVYNAATIEQGGITHLSRVPTLVSVILEETPNPIGISPAIVGQRIILDPEPRGQFDQCVDILRTHIQLMALTVDNADDMIHADVWVKDLIGTMPRGGGSYIQLGPQGATGRLAPASPSFSLFQELQGLIENFHLAARWPKTRSGEVDQSQASGKFVETTVGVMNQVIRTGHSIMKVALGSALNVAFRADKLCGKKRVAAGIRANQQFLLERDVDDIDLDARVRAEYGIGFGHTPSESAVLAIQYHGAGFVSTETVQENLEGIVDVGLERRRLLLQQFKDMALAQMLQGLQDKSLPPRALVDISRAVQNGGDVFEVFEKFIVKPQEDQLEQQYPSGLTGEMMSPGGPPALGGGAAPPTPPPPEDLLAGLLGAGGAPEAPETIGRLSVPLGNGGFAGSQSSG